MSETKHYVVDPESLEGCRIRVSFHFKELQQESNPVVRVNIAQYLAEATATLAQLEAEEAHKVTM